MPARTLPTPPLRVLVADDIASSRDALAERVRSLGHVCLVARSGMETLQRVAADQPDLLLLDLLMPDLDGFEVTRRVREQVLDRWIPVIVTSALQGEEHFIHALSEGADDYLTRPVSPPLLEAKLRHYSRVLSLQSRLGVLAQRQRAIYEHIADAIVTIDADGLVCEANPAANRLFAACGHPEPDGAPLRDILGATLQELVATGEIDVAVQGGQPLPLGVAASHWSSGAESFTTVALHDLTERRRMEHMKDEFLATVSHELRTPLTSVVGALGLIASGAGGALPAEALELVQVARRNGQRLGRLIDDLLDLTKLEGNQMVLHMRPANLATQISEAVAANAAYARKGGVTLEFEQPAQPAWSVIDTDRFLQVMANLLSNAIKHSHEGQAVQVSLCGVPGGWQVAVTDHGPGIDPAFRARLFGKFAQADSSDRRAQGGTGLGLYISRRLVERMGGSIGAQSQPGQGATFSIVFPAHQESAGAVATSTAADCTPQPLQSIRS